MNTRGLEDATATKRSIVSQAIDEAKELLNAEYLSGKLIEAYRDHRSGNETRFLTLAFFLAKTKRRDTGKAVNQRALYKKTRTNTRAEVEQFNTGLEKKLLAALQATGKPAQTRIQELENENKLLKDQLAKLRDHLHVAYERERARRRAARHAVLAEKRKVVPIRK